MHNMTMNIITNTSILEYGAVLPSLFSSELYVLGKSCSILHLCESSKRSSEASKPKIQISQVLRWGATSVMN